MKPIADLILENGRITTLDPRHPEVNEVVIVGDLLSQCSLS
jgi:predicted amidohydrolase YtcJ